jgi:hypothetical protein
MEKGGLVDVNQSGPVDASMMRTMLSHIVTDRQLSIESAVTGAFQSIHIVR